MTSRGDIWFDNKANKHFRTRAVGNLLVGPLQAKGYDNRVTRLSLSEMEFQNSNEAQQFMETHRRKYADSSRLCRNNKLRYVSRNDSSD